MKKIFPAIGALVITLSLPMPANAASLVPPESGGGDPMKIRSDLNIIPSENGNKNSRDVRIIISSFHKFCIFKGSIEGKKEGDRNPDAHTDEFNDAQMERFIKTKALSIQNLDNTTLVKAGGISTHTAPLL